MTTPFLIEIRERRPYSPSLRNCVSSVVADNMNCSPRRNRWRVAANRVSANFMRNDFRRLGRIVSVAIATGDEDKFSHAVEELQSEWSRNLVDYLIDKFEQKNNSAPEHFQCEHCGSAFLGREYALDWSGCPLCESCTDSYYLYSECMDGYINTEAAYPVFNSVRAIRRDSADDYCTRNYGARHFVRHSEVHGFMDEDTYSEYCDECEDGDSDDDDDRRRQTSLLADYHSGVDIGHIPSAAYDKKRVWLGMELEIECGTQNRMTVVESLHSHVNTDRKYVRFETDGSLHYGFEIISGYTGLDVHEKWLKRFANANLQGCKSHDTSTCGLHVHIDKRDMTPFEAARLMLFINNPANERLVRAVARRYGREAGYAKFGDKSKTAVHAAHVAAKRRHNDLSWMNEDRYEALNFQPERTIEYRLYRGTLKVETIMACLEFTWLSYWFARQTSITQLGTEDFIKWISQPENKRESRYLRQMLAAKGLMPPQKSATKQESASPEVETDTPPAPRSRRGEEAVVNA